MKDRGVIMGWFIESLKKMKWWNRVILVLFIVLLVLGMFSDVVMQGM